ncbi:hypothetical protein D5H75_23820 [Bailinhaonella thermotolerans]|uniref:Uncharacterized protein n=2 Tax=Bailinhaonella thermotolerans TaxID=1070861 RepID=A0A3A4AND4_9ACTN|nr:hypothetical protein D5H75_23820 [Bailinhaonella thermotolerans]
MRPAEMAPAGAPAGGRGGMAALGVAAAVLPALVLAGYRPGPWWAWFPLVAGLVLLASGMRMLASDKRWGDIVGRSHLFAGAAATTTGLLLLFEAMDKGWVAYPMVLGVEAALLYGTFSTASPVASALRRIVMAWGAVTALTGAMLALQVSGAADVSGLFGPFQWWGALIIALGAAVSVEAARLWRSTGRGAGPMSTILAVAGAALVIQGVSELFAVTDAIF